MRICSICDKPEHCKGYCRLHYDRLRRGWSIEKLMRPVSISTRGQCSLCSEPHHAKGYCRTHYNRIGWAPERMFEPKHPQRVNCSICPAKHHAKGFCLTHYHQRRHEWRFGECVICKQPCYAKGYCEMHYSRSIRGWSPEEMTLPRGMRRQSELDWAKCGRPGQYRAHLRRGENCDICLAAERRRLRKSY